MPKSELKTTYTVISSGLVNAKCETFPKIVQQIVAKVIRVLEREPDMICLTPETSENSNVFIIGIRDCPGGALIARVNLNQFEKQVTLLEIVWPATLLER